MSERYRNKRTLFRGSGGRYRKATLQDMGIPQSLVNHEKIACDSCAEVWMPILKTGLCPKCGKANKQEGA